MKKTTTSDLALTSHTDLTSAVDATWDGVWQSFDQFCLIAGVAALSEMLDDDVKALAGDAHARNADKPGYRWGRTKGRVGFHGGKVALENGAVESHNRHLKTALDQALILRGSRDFADLADWRRFVDQLVARRNRRREAAVRTEAAALRALPARRTTDFTELVVRVTRTGGFLVRGVFYSAPSRLIGQRLRVHVHDDRIEAWLGGTHVVRHPRLRQRDDGRRVHRVDYRHVIHALRRKPQALAGSVYRDGLFPRTEYTAAWVALSEALPQREACRRMVDLLWLAHDEGCEAELAALIADDIAAGGLPDARDLAKRLEPRRRELPADVPVALTELASFDALLEVRA